MSGDKATATPDWPGPRLRPPKPVLLVVAAFSRHAGALDWGRAQLEATYGPVALISEPFSFHHTEYYQPTMGPGLAKQFFVFERLVSEDCLPEAKHHTNALETQLAAQHGFAEQRPLNLDPGILTLGKFLLATTKDLAHRIYLRDNIYAEVTLRYQAGAFQPWPWTFPDYREPALHAFLLTARDFYRRQLEKSSRISEGGPLVDKGN
jgi:hypothetical protein